MSVLSSKRKQIKVKAVAPKLKLFRANEPLLSVFMWGVNHTVSNVLIRTLRWKKIAPQP